MSQEQSQAKGDAQAGSASKAANVGPAVGGVHSSEDWSWFDITGASPQMMAWLREQRRDSARTHACQRSKGQGDGPGKKGIITPEKIRKLQCTLYRKAKAEPRNVHERMRCGEATRKAGYGKPVRPV